MNKRDKKLNRIPIEEDKMRAVDLFLNRINQAFAFYFWVRSVHPMLAKHSNFQNEQFKIVTVKNACLQSTLICIRDLDDFFAEQKNINVNSREGDIHADDFFGYKSPGRFLKSERDLINQWIAHLTYHPIWNGTTGIPPERNIDWNIVELLGRVTLSACGFMNHLITVLTIKDPEQANSIQNIKKGFEARLKEMESIVRDPTNTKLTK